MKLDRVKKILGEEVVDLLNSGQTDELRITVVQAEKAMKEAKEELEANPKYQELKELLGALTSGLKEVNKYQRAKIEYCLYLLQEKGE